MSNPKIFTIGEEGLSIRASVATGGGPGKILSRAIRCANLHNYSYSGVMVAMSISLHPGRPVSRQPQPSRQREAVLASSGLPPTALVLT